MTARTQPRSLRWATHASGHAHVHLTLLLSALPTPAEHAATPDHAVGATSDATITTSRFTSTLSVRALGLPDTPSTVRRAPRNRPTYA